MNIKCNKAAITKKDNYLHEIRAPVPTPQQIDKNYSDKNDDLLFSTPSTTPKRCVKEMKMLDRTYRKVEIPSCEKSEKKNPGNRLVKLSSLIDLIEKNTVCRECGSDIKISDETVGIATSVVMTCKKCGEKKSECVRTKLDKTSNNKKYKTVESFATNTLFVLGCNKLVEVPQNVKLF